jgi:hypothetical protein
MIVSYCSTVDLVVVLVCMYIYYEYILKDSEYSYLHRYILYVCIVSCVYGRYGRTTGFLDLSCMVPGTTYSSVDINVIVSHSTMYAYIHILISLVLLQTLRCLVACSAP